MNKKTADFYGQCGQDTFSWPLKLAPIVVEFYETPTLKPLILLAY